jgi:hypothetical protein
MLELETVTWLLTIRWFSKVNWLDISLIYCMQYFSYICLVASLETDIITVFTLQ